jgi:DNA-binding XRE family transcriptional regulator
VKDDSLKIAIISPAQIRAARALLNIEQATLAKDAGISRQTLISIEAESRDQADPRRRKKMDAIKIALEELHGIDFLSDGSKGEGVRLKVPRKLTRGAG